MHSSCKLSSGNITSVAANRCRGMQIPSDTDGDREVRVTDTSQLGKQALPSKFSLRKRHSQAEGSAQGWICAWGGRGLPLE